MLPAGRRRSKGDRAQLGCIERGWSKRGRGKQCIRHRRGDHEPAAAQAFADALQEIGDGALGILQRVEQREDAIDDAGFAGADIGALVEELAARMRDAEAWRRGGVAFALVRQRAEARDGVQEECEFYGALGGADDIAQFSALAAEPAADDQAKHPTHKTQRRSGERFDAGFSQEGWEMLQDAASLRAL